MQEIKNNKIIYIVTKSISCYLFLSVFDGLIRGISFQLGIIWGAFIKDIILINLYVFSIVLIIKKHKVNKNAIYMGSLILYGIFVGFANNLPLVQMIFALKLFIPVFIGFLLNKYINYKILLRDVYIVLICAIIGLTLNKFINFPWQDIDLSHGRTVLRTAYVKNWGQIKRLPGFGASDGITAFIILTSWVAITIFRKLEEVSIFASKNWLLLTVVVFFSLLISTSKSSLITFIIICIVLYAEVKERRYKSFFLSFFPKFIRISPLLILIIPFFASYIYYLRYGVLTKLSIKDLLSFSQINLLVGSFLARILQVWPKAFKYTFSDSLSFYIGNGFGSVGPASVKFGKNITHVGDGLMLCLVSYFGVVVSCGMLILLKMKDAIAKNGYMTNSFSIYLILIFVLGSTRNIIDTPVILLWAGIIYNSSKIMQ